ncbi:MAG: hypothetical protein WBO45_19915 [Planctomycetota bacterium]
MPRSPMMNCIPNCSPVRSLALALPLLATVAGLRAQCTYSWPAAPFGTGADSGVFAAALQANGNLVVGGNFTTVGGTAASRIAQWNGTSWSALGTGMNGDVHALRVLANGDLVAGGAFTTAGGTTVNCLARWNGSTWSAFASGVDALAPFGSSVQALAVLPNGDLVIGGSFAAVSGVPAANIARWNGVAWSAFTTGTNGPVKALAVTPGGGMFVAGSFTTAGGVLCNSFARWQTGAWAAAGTGLGLFGADCLAVMPNNDIVVGGSFLTAGGAPANRIARWNGAAWSTFGTGMNAVVTALCALPNGDLVAGGLFTNAGGGAANLIARWNGSAWSAFGSGVDAAPLELLQDLSGAVVVAGNFTTAGGNAANRLARITSSCAPGAANLGSGCSGTGGLNALAMTSPALVGSTFRATGTGMPPLGLVLAVTGFTSTSLPLNFVLPQALPGCTLYANPDVIDVLVPAAGSAQWSLALANSPALVGVVFFHQFVPFELDLLFNITAVTASNALQVTVGTF